jgi:hypothetical protein
VKWALLYTRSRGVPFGLLMVVLCTAAVAAVSHVLDGGSVGWGVFLLMLAVDVLGVGLAGQDPQLDGTAAIRWRPRRLIHLLLIGVLGAAAVLALGDAYGTPVLVLRNALGMLGLLGVATLLFGAQFGWLLPMTWCLFAVVMPGGRSTPYEIGAWMMQPLDATVGNWTAGVLGTVGAMTYAVVGPRR